MKWSKYIFLISSILKTTYFSNLFFKLMQNYEGLPERCGTVVCLSQNSLDVLKLYVDAAGQGSLN